MYDCVYGEEGSVAEARGVDPLSCSYYRQAVSSLTRTVGTQLRSC